MTPAEVEKQLEDNTNAFNLASAIYTFSRAFCLDIGKDEDYYETILPTAMTVLCADLIASHISEGDFERTDERWTVIQNRISDLMMSECGEKPTKSIRQIRESN